VTQKTRENDVGRRVRSHFVYVYWVALVLIFGWAIWLRFSLPSAPTADPDTWGYLSPAMGKLIGTGWVHHLRNYFYPGFLFLLLRVFDDFRAITAVQHLLGVAAGGLFLVVWRRTRDFATPARVPREVHALMGLGAVAIYLFALDPMRFETSIRPEGIAPFIVMLNIWLVVEFAWRCWMRRTERLPLALGWAAVGSAVILSLARPSLAIAATGALAPVAAAVFGRFPLRSKLVFVGGSIVVAGALLLPEEFLARGDDDAETFLPTDLFMIHAAIIRDQMAADVASGASLPYPTDWLRRTERRLTAEITKSGNEHPYPTLGLQPDYLMFGPDSFHAGMRREFRGRSDEMCAFYRFYYWRTWREQPKRMVAKIARQFRVFYASPCPAYHLTKTWRIRHDYVLSREAMGFARFGKIWANYPPLATLISRTEHWAHSPLVVRGPSPIEKWKKYLAFTYLPCLAVAIGLATYVFIRQPSRRRLGLLAALVLFSYWYNFGTCLEIAIVHSLDNHRYDRMQLIFTVLAQSATFLLAVEFALETGALFRAARAQTVTDERFG
jgi:hypothetical protein